MAPKPRLSRAQYGEDRCGICRGDNDAEEQAVERSKIQEPDCEYGDECSRKANPEGRERQAFSDHLTNLLPVGVQATGEQDKRQGNDAEGLRKPGIVELNTTWAFRAG